MSKVSKRNQVIRLSPKHCEVCLLWCGYGTYETIQGMEERVVIKANSQFIEAKEKVRQFLDETDSVPYSLPELRLMLMSKPNILGEALITIMANIWITAQEEIKREVSKRGKRKGMNDEKG